MTFLLAEASMDTITPLVTNLGVLGALVWYMYYTTAVTIPKIHITHSEDSKALAENHTNSLDKITNQFSETIRDEREIRKQELEALRNWIKQEASCRYNKDHP